MHHSEEEAYGQAMSDLRLLMRKWVAGWLSRRQVAP
jgi:hypothetical protein